jgi:hypothetical protein
MVIRKVRQNGVKTKMETEQEETEKKYYVFKARKEGWVTISRHEFPDFCAGITKEERDKFFIVKEIMI